MYIKVQAINKRPVKLQSAMININAKIIYPKMVFNSYHKSPLTDDKFPASAARL
jgi:hypothetical protein